MKVKNDAIGKKNQGFNEIRTGDLRDTGTMLYQLNYEAQASSFQLHKLENIQRSSFLTFRKELIFNDVNRNFRRNIEAPYITKRQTR